jgi:hypothetical protein
MLRDGRKYAVSAKYVPYPSPSQLLRSVPNCCSLSRYRGRGDGRPSGYEYNSADLVAVSVDYIANYRTKDGRLGRALTNARVDVTPCYEIKPFPR